MKLMANTILLSSSLTVTKMHFVTNAMPIGYINSNCHISKMKSSRTCLIGYSDVISNEWFFIAWGWGHTHTHIYTHVYIHKHACKCPHQSDFKKLSAGQANKAHMIVAMHGSKQLKLMLQ